MQELLEHPFMPVIVTQYIPCCDTVVILLAFVKLIPFLVQLYVNGDTPPVALAVNVELAVEQVIVFADAVRLAEGPSML